MPACLASSVGVIRRSGWRRSVGFASGGAGSSVSSVERLRWQRQRASVRCHRQASYRRLRGSQARSVGAAECSVRPGSGEISAGGALDRPPIMVGRLAGSCRAQAQQRRRSGAAVRLARQVEDELWCLRVARSCEHPLAYAGECS